MSEQKHCFSFQQKGNICRHQTRSLGGEYAKMNLPQRLCPKPRWGSLLYSPEPHLDLNGGNIKGKGKAKKEKEGNEEKTSPPAFPFPPKKK